MCPEHGSLVRLANLQRVWLRFAVTAWSESPNLFVVLKGKLDKLAPRLRIMTGTQGADEVKVVGMLDPGLDVVEDVLDFGCALHRRHRGTGERSTQSFAQSAQEHVHA